MWTLNSFTIFKRRIFCCLLKNVLSLFSLRKFFKGKKILVVNLISRLFNFNHLGGKFSLFQPAYCQLLPICQLQYHLAIFMLSFSFMISFTHGKTSVFSWFFFGRSFWHFYEAQSFHVEKIRLFIWLTCHRGIRDIFMDQYLLKNLLFAKLRIFLEAFLDFFLR